VELTINLKTLHPNQEKVIQGQKRFNVLKCGRRWGKTEIATDLAVNALLDGKYVAYYAPTYKDVYETWNMLKNTLFEVIRSKDEQVKQITTITNGTLDIWSMDNPDSGRGRKYHLVVDECEKANKFKEAWEQTIRATLTDYKGTAWFLSTPKFGKTYFKELFRTCTKYDDWAAFKFTTYDNPFIDHAEIETVKHQLDSMTFRCEFMADDVDLSLNPFAYAFSKEKHIKECEYNPQEYLQLAFDFNVDPITCIAAQSTETGKVNIIKEFRLEQSDIYELCQRIKVAYPDSVFIITGDATGHNRSALTRGNINYYSVIKKELNLVDTQMKQPAVNPAAQDTRVLMNSILQNGEINIDPSCEYLIEDMIYCEVDSEGDIDKTKDKHQTHLLDCVRYLLNTFHKTFLKY
jgi:hypothetical protein